jgi:hypothetical protein
MSEKKVPETTAPAAKPPKATQNAEIAEKELNKVTGGTTGHANQDVAGRRDPLDRNTV